MQENQQGESEWKDKTEGALKCKAKKGLKKPKQAACGEPNAALQ